MEVIFFPFLKKKFFKEEHINCVKVKVILIETHEIQVI